jgi:hypothetical protein
VAGDEVPEQHGLEVLSDQPQPSMQYNTMGTGAEDPHGHNLWCTSAQLQTVNFQGPKARWNEVSQDGIHRLRKSPAGAPPAFRERHATC